ncbi:hypothetical protein E1301_Tti008686 [Triplophysa tibetana]|uniref:Ubiquitin-like domain-containing protein n=1 Tax=Triplophysa tibetana TaxID=1572043 RepID=A0A5A9PKB5_9TELE|nr:hypothetical protein E1301_Tti008686 [Triplophysa tibetana]
MGGIYSIFYETEQEISPPESSSFIPVTSLTSQREPTESSKQHQHEAVAVQSVPLPPQPDEISQVEKINFNVKCAGKSIPIDMFPFERISVFLKEACDQAEKKPEKMNLIYEGEVLNVNNTVSQYNLRGGSTVNLIHAC